MQLLLNFSSAQSTEIKAQILHRAQLSTSYLFVNTYTQVYFWRARHGLEKAEAARRE